MDHRPFRVGSLAVIGAVLLGGCATTAISSSVVTTTTSTSLVPVYVDENTYGVLPPDDPACR